MFGQVDGAICANSTAKVRIGGKIPYFKDAATPADVADGSVTGYAATFDREPDCYGDVIAPGAFADSLKRRGKVGKPIPLLYGHNTQDPRYNIGAVTKSEEDGRGLLVEAEFDGESECAQQVRHLVRTGRLYQLSFAFDVLEDGEVMLDDGAKAHELRRLELYEVGLVQIPANQHAEVTEVKERGSKYGRRNSKADEDTISVRLPVRTALLQNDTWADTHAT